MKYYCGTVTVDGELIILRDSQEQFLLYDSSSSMCHVAIPAEPIMSDNLDAMDLIDAGDIVTLFSWGFGCVVVIGYFSGLAIGVAKKLIGLV